MMIEALCKENIVEVLSHPQYYVDSSEDVVLLKIHDEEDINNPTYLMIGVDEYNKYYLVVEDNDTSEDYVPKDESTLLELYIELLEEIIK